LSTAFITGITGQDGSYLTELLLGKGYEVHGLVRRASSFNTQRIDHLYQDPHEVGGRLHLHYGDVTDASRLIELVGTIQPDEVYNLAAQSHVAVSFQEPANTIEIDGLGVLNILQAIRFSCPQAKLYQAGTSEMFGASPPPQNEDTPFEPQSPYAVAKVLAYHLVKTYREGYAVFAATGILFNHESERRGLTFVTRKITRGIAAIVAGTADRLFLGNLHAERDWGHAADYVTAMWSMLQQPEPRDYVIGTGEAHTVAEFCEHAFRLVGLDWQEFVEIDPRYFRPTEVDRLRADASRARHDLGWTPEIGFAELVERMVENDLRDVGLDLDQVRTRAGVPRDH
jgi:GDPmannose 4,6-dehydratase